MNTLPHAFSVDLEDWFQVDNLRGVIARDAWDRQPLRIERNTQRLLELFDLHGARVTFFVLGWIADRLPALIKTIHTAGHEIASHGTDHQSLRTLRPDTFGTSLRAQKARLEDLIGESVIGFRAPSFSIIRATRWALTVLSECGFVYDSSIMPVCRKRYGVLGAPTAPHRIQLPGGGSIIELPPSVIRILGWPVAIGGGGYFRFWPYSVTRWAAHRIAAREQPFCFYLHPWEIDPEQPHMHGMHAYARTLHYLNLGKTEARLMRLLHDFRFRPYRELLRDVPADARVTIVADAAAALAPAGG